LAATYNILPGLSISALYLFEQGNLVQNNLKDINTYSTRLMINQFTQTDVNGNLSFPVPRGGILGNTNEQYTTNSGRFQTVFNKSFSAKHQINALGGFEVKDYKFFHSYQTLYGYNTDNATSLPVDYFTNFTQQIGGSVSKIAYGNNQYGITDHFISYYVNASYTYNAKYVVSSSFRRDESNLFGVRANQKGVPLYSAGFAWHISDEAFYKLKFLPYLNLRITGGYNGNLSKNISAYTTAKVMDYNNLFNQIQQIIINPPNPDLSWERIKIINTGLDFAILNKRVSGSVEYYYKRGLDLIGNSPVAPQTGIIQFTGNTADITTKGVDLVVNSINIKTRKFEWSTNFLLSFVKDKITDYKMQAGNNALYVTQNYMTPAVGKPYSAIFAYPFARLDSTGNPIGYLNKKESNNYTGIISSTDINDLKYIGPATPTVFGSFRNNFSYRAFEVSFNIIYKLGYYFRRGSFNPSIVGYQQADYANRWQNPGDEVRTNVPALVYPFNQNRDLFYQGSDVLVEKADQIRLRDIQISYTIGNKILAPVFKSIRIYGYVNNLGILWRANKLGLDPDYVGRGFYSIPNSKAYSIGFSATF
jgi:hypothetical protein